MNNNPENIPVGLELPLPHEVSRKVRTTCDTPDRSHINR